MTGHPQFNFPLFDEVSDVLAARYDFDVISPAAHDRLLVHEMGWKDGLHTIRGFASGDAPMYYEATGLTKEETYGWDLDMIRQSADALCMLPGWEDSEGATAERALAIEYGLPVYLVQRGPHPGEWGLSVKLPERLATPFTDLLEAEYHAAEGEIAALTDQAFHDFCNRSGLGIDPAAADGLRIGSPDEHRVTNPVTGGEKGAKLARYDLIPAGPLFDLAEHYGRGAEKYADRNWEKGVAWSLNFAAAQRHFWQWWGGEDYDEETGSPHLAAVAWHVFSLLEYALTHPELDDRPSQ